MRDAGLMDERAASHEATPPGGRDEVKRVAGEVMSIDEIVTEAAGDTIRVRGRLLLPPDAAWRQLAEGLAPLGRTPLLKKTKDGAAEELLALPRTFAAAGSQRRGLAALLFVLTVLSCLFAGAQMVPSRGGAGLNLNLFEGLPFAAGLLAILLAHEFGHYFVAQRLGRPHEPPLLHPDAHRPVRHDGRGDHRRSAHS